MSPAREIPHTERDASGETRLWQAVVMRQVKDAVRRPSKGTERHDVWRADAWLRDCGKEMRLTCELAGLDPHFISEAYKNGKLTAERLMRAESQI